MRYRLPILLMLKDQSKEPGKNAVIGKEGIVRNKS